MGARDLAAGGLAHNRDAVPGRWPRLHFPHLHIGEDTLGSLPCPVAACLVPRVAGKSRPAHRHSLSPVSNNKPRHMEHFKSLWEQNSIGMGPCPTGSGRGAP